MGSNEIAATEREAKGRWEPEMAMRKEASERKYGGLEGKCKGKQGSPTRKSYGSRGHRSER